MYETTNDLISWNEPERIGPMPGSEWTCPHPTSAFLSSPLTGGILTRDDIRTHFGGQDQYLELLQYPEGPHFAVPADSCTEDLLWSPDHLYRYVNPADGAAGHWEQSQPNDILPISPSTNLQAVYAEDGAIASAVAPVPGLSTPFVEKSTMRISPDRQRLHIGGKALLKSVKRGTVSAGADQRLHDVSGFVAVGEHALDNVHAHMNGVRLNFDSGGQLTDIRVSDPAWLKRILGLWRQPQTFHYSEDKITIQPGDKSRVASGLAELINVRTLTEIDLHALVDGLYKTLGRPGFSPVLHIKSPRE